MIDLGKTISGLKEIADYFNECRGNASFGSKAEERFWEFQSAARDAVELLMKQEPVKPIEVQREETIEDNEVFTATKVWAEWYCPECHRKIAERYSPHKSYCKWCGQAVKWDD